MYGLLAHHFAEADAPERAVGYLVKAGDAARAGYAQEEAIGLYRRALGFMERTRDAARARSTLLKIALTHHLAFDYAPRTKPSAKRSPDLRQRLRGSNLASEPRGRVRPGTGGRTRARLGKPAAEVIVNLFRGLVSCGRDLDVSPISRSVSPSPTTGASRFTLRTDVAGATARR